MTAREDLSVVIDKAIRDNWVRVRSDTHGLTLAVADAVLAAGFTRPCAHSWQPLPFAALEQPCGDCDETRHHVCLFNCDQHLPLTSAQLAAARALFDRGML